MRAHRPTFGILTVIGGAIALTSGLSLAEPGNGEVVDGLSGKPLGGVTVWARDLKTGKDSQPVVSDPNGRFTLDAPAGDVILLFSKKHYLENPAADPWNWPPAAKALAKGSLYPEGLKADSVGTFVE